MRSCELVDLSPASRPGHAEHGKIAATPTAGLYYVEQVSRGVEDYYAGEVETPGAWAGAAAAALGLGAKVCEEEILRLLRGENPASGDALRQPLAAGAVAGSISRSGLRRA